MYIYKRWSIEPDVPPSFFLKQFIQNIVSPLYFSCNLIPLPLQPEKIIIEKKKKNEKENIYKR